LLLFRSQDLVEPRPQVGVEVGDLLLLLARETQFVAYKRRKDGRGATAARTSPFHPARTPGPFSGLSLAAACLVLSVLSAPGIATAIGAASFGHCAGSATVWAATGASWPCAGTSTVIGSAPVSLRTQLVFTEFAVAVAIQPLDRIGRQANFVGRKFAVMIQIDGFECRAGRRRGRRTVPASIAAGSAPRRLGRCQGNAD
jgi:hypothetical protein